MKKLLFTAYSLGLGGIETALVNLLNNLDYEKYDVTLILEKKEGIFLDEIPKQVHVLEYKISESKNILNRKIYNRFKLIKWYFKLHNKYDFACSYATYSIPGSHLARIASKNNALWMHNNFYILYGDEMNNFLDGIKARKFKKIVFVSNDNLNDICDHYDGLKDKSIVCNNYIDGKTILEKAEEEIDFKKKKIPTLVNVGRHEEHQKKLTRIIEAAKKLKDENYEFQILFVGDGVDSELYHSKVAKYELEDNVIFLGKKQNPFPYYKLANAVVLSSDYEGYPVVFLESMILDKPILSTKVSDWEELDNIAGTFCELSDEGVYQNIKDYLDKPFKIKNHFDYKEYNKDISKIIENLINN